MRDPFDVFFDVFDRMDPLARMGMASGGRNRQPPTWEPLPEQEAEDWKDRLARTGVSGLTYVGQTLDKAFGGRAVRAGLAGNWKDVLSAVPLSDTFGLTDVKNSTSGEDLLKQWGAWRPNDPNRFELRDLAGAGVEMLLDPGTYLTFGGSALTKAGKAAKAAGTLPTSMAQRIHGFDRIASTSRLSDEALRHAANAGELIADKATSQAAKAMGHKLKTGEALGGLVGIGLPFRDPTFVLGKGKWAEGTVGKWADDAADFLQHGNWTGRNLTALFDSRVQGATEAEAQRSAIAAFTPTVRRLTQEGKGVEYDLLRRMQRFAGTKEEQDALRLMREVGERGVDPASGYITPIPKRLQGPANFRSISEAGQAAADRSKQVFDERRAAGAPIKQGGDDFTDHLPRQSRAAFEHAQGIQVDRGKTFGMTSSANIPRVFHDIPGGAAQVDSWAMKWAGDKDTKLKDLADNILGDMVNTARLDGHTMTTELMDKLKQTSKHVAKELRGMDPRYRLNQETFFQPDPIRDLGRQTHQHARAIGSAEAVYDVVKRRAERITDANKEGMVPLATFARTLGMPTYGSADEIQGSFVRMYEALARHGEGLASDVIGGGHKNTRAQFEKRINQYGIPRDVAEQFTKRVNKWVDPQEMVQPLNLWDRLANQFKNWTYTAWLPSHIRNLGSAGWMNTIYSGTRFGDYADQARIMLGRAPKGDVPGIRRSMAEKAKIDAIRGRQYASSLGSIYGGHNVSTDAATRAVGMPTGMGPGQIMQPMPGDFSRIREGLFQKPEVAEGSGTLFGYSVPDWLRKPIEARQRNAPFDPLSDQNAWIRGHRRLGTVIEDFMRGANWLGNVRRGMTDDVASQMVDRIHFNYGDLTNFEKKVMKRIVPFYTFMRKNLPLQVNTAATDPVKLSAPIRFLTKASEATDAYLPEYVASGVAIPYGETPDGEKQFVTSLGLPFEEAFSRFKFRNNAPDILGTSMAFASGMNPLIKGPLEQLSGKQFYSGRDLADLRAPTAAQVVNPFDPEYDQPVAQFLSNTPLTRFITTADRAIDPRKSALEKLLNLATGVRVSSIDTDKYRAIDARENLERILSRRPGISDFTNYYVRPDQLGMLTPEDATFMRLYANLKDDAREFAEQRERERQQMIGVYTGAG